MPLPSEITNLLTPAHAHAALDGVEHWIVSKVTGALGDRVWKAAQRRFKPALLDGDFETVKKRLERLEAFLGGLEDERMSAHSVDNAAEFSNAAEPAFDDFLERAIQSASATASEGKQLLIGRIAGKRAGAYTESFLDLQMREALSITDRVNLQQLYAVAALLLIGHTPMPPPPADLRGLFARYDQTYYPAFKKAIESDWTQDDLKYLVSIGAMMLDSTDAMMEGITSRLGRRIAPGGPYQPVPMNVFDHQSSPFVALAEEFDSQIKQPQTNPRSLVAFSLTPAGLVLGATLLEGLCPEESITLPEQWQRPGAV